MGNFIPTYTNKNYNLDFNPKSYCNLTICNRFRICKYAKTNEDDEGYTHTDINTYSSLLYSDVCHYKRDDDGL